MKRYLLLIILLILTLISCECSYDNQLLIMLYNTQQLTFNSEEAILHNRLRNLSKVVRKSSIYTPDVLILLEVEGKKVIEPLVNEHLPHYSYTLITNYNDTKMQMAVLSKYPIIEANYIDGDSIIRPILHFRILSHNKILDVLAFHNKSQNEGFEQTKDDRINSMKMLKKEIRNLEERDLIILGDANIDPIHKYGEVQSVSTVDINNGIIEVSEDINSMNLYFPLTKELRVDGSYVYNNIWYYLDHIYIPYSLRNNSGIEFIKAGMGYFDELVTPYKTIYSYDSNSRSGYSDHLPVWALLKLKNKT